ncbi:MAG: AAA family ATPase [Bacteroidales bacterium]|nr:AAA family ATPase [Candidatus Colicola faecequi]
MTIGLCFGRYAPFCKGHLDLIMRAKKECDLCFVICMGSSSNDGHFIMPFRERVAYMRECFADSPEVRVLALDDDELYPELPLTEKGWQLWTAAAEQLVFSDPAVPSDALFRWYVRDPAWKDALMRVSTTADPVKAMLEEGRFEIRIAESKGSPEPVLPWKPGCYEGPVRRVLITGTASEGKSTLARDIALYFGLPYVPEEARNYMQEMHVADPDLTTEDFLQFVRRQNASIDRAQERVAIVDTDNITTLAYAMEYAADPDIKAIDEASVEAVRSEVRTSGWDRIFLLAPRNRYVDDGFRYMKQADMTSRQQGFDLLLRLFEEYGLADKVEILRGDYYSNFLRVKDVVAELLAQ